MKIQGLPVAGRGFLFGGDREVSAEVVAALLSRRGYGSVGSVTLPAGALEKVLRVFICVALGHNDEVRNSLLQEAARLLQQGGKWAVLEALEALRTSTATRGLTPLLTDISRTQVRWQSYSTAGREVILTFSPGGEITVEWNTGTRSPSTFFLQSGLYGLEEEQISMEISTELEPLAAPRDAWRRDPPSANDILDRKCVYTSDEGWQWP